MSARIKDIPGLQKPSKPSGKISLQRGEIKRGLTPQDIRTLCGNKEKYPICFCASSPGFQLSDTKFLLQLQPNSLKELDLSSNELSAIVSLSEQKKLKRLVLDKNCIASVSLKGLGSLQHVSLAFNELEYVPDLSDCTKCIYIDLRGNRIQDFSHLSTASSLRVIDLQKNNIDVSLSVLQSTVLKPLKDLPKLQFLSFESNPIEVKMNNFRYFIIHEFPKLEYYNYTRITREDRSKAAELASTVGFQYITSERSAVHLRSPLALKSTESDAALLTLIEGAPDINRHDSIAGTLAPDVESDFAALDTILESLESPMDEPMSVTDNSDLDDLLNDLGISDNDSDDDLFLSVVSEQEKKETQTKEIPLRKKSTPLPMKMEESDGLDDILNYLDEPIDGDDFVMEEMIMEDNTPASVTRGSQIMGVASTQSIANKPVVIEDEADYFDLLKDMIEPSPGPQDHEVDSSDILSMLDELITPNEPPAPKSLTQKVIKEHGNLETRDSLSDLLGSLEEANAESSAIFTIDSLLDNTINAREEPQGPQDDDLNDLLSEMLNESPTNTRNVPIKQPDTFIDPLDELANSLADWESEKKAAVPLPPVVAVTVEDPLVIQRREREEAEKIQQRELEAKQEQLRQEEEAIAQREEQRQAKEEVRKQKEQEDRIARESKEKERKLAEERRTEEEMARKQIEEEERAAREEVARKQKEEILAREEALRLKREEEIRFRVEEEERIALQRLKELELEELRIEEELREHSRQQEERQKEEARLREEEERRKEEKKEAQRLRDEEERKRIEDERIRNEEIERKRKEVEAKEKEMKMKIEKKRQLLLQQQQEAEEQKERETEEMMQLLEEEQRREEEKRALQEEKERRAMEEKGYVDELINQVDVNSSPIDDLSGFDSTELNDLRQMAFSYGIDANEVQIFELLGSGTFGSCYRGIRHQKEVIVKKLNCNMIQDVYFMDQFKKEASLICSLQHPHLIDVKGVSVVGELTLITEYIQGSPLFGILRNRGVVLDIAEKIRFAQQIAMAIGYLHEQDIVFLGLKTKNILINSNNDVILRDFGLHCVKDFVKKQGAIGTPQYTAPEEINSPSNSIHQKEGDVFSFGIVLWELFSGKSPYKGMMARQVMAAVTNDGERPKEPLDCPIVLWKVMQSCWQQDPATRPDINRIIRILNQPLPHIMKYGMTAGSTEPAPRGAPVNAQAAYDAAKVSKNSSPATGNSKIHSVLKQVTQMLQSNNLEMQTKALKVLINIGRTESNIEPIIGTSIITMIHTLLKSPTWQLRESSGRALSVLCEWPACEKVVRENGLILALVENLSHSSEVVILQNGKAIITLSQEAESQVAIRACGGLTPLLSMLDSNNDMIRLQSVWAFSLLLENEAFQQDFFEAGGVRSLLMLLGSPNPGIQFRVLVALTNLIGNPRTYPVIEKAGVLKRFLLLLGSKSPVLRLQAAKATERMSAKGALRSEITRHGGMETLIALLHPDNDQELIMAGLGSLINFAKDKKQILAFKQAGGLPAVLQILENKTPSIQYQGIRFFESFIDGDELNKEISRAIGFIPRCIGLLTSSHPGIQSTSISILAELIQSTTCTSAILSSGGLPPLLSLVDHPELFVKQKTMIVISALTKSDPSVKDTIINTGSLNKLIGLLRAPELKTKEAASLILCLLSSDVRVKALLKSMNAIPSFVSVLVATSDCKVQEGILSACNNFIRDGDSNSILMQSGAAQAIISKLNSSDSVVQTAAIRCSLLLCSNAQNKDALLSLDIIPQLKTIESSSSSSLKAAASKCISFLQ